MDPITIGAIAAPIAGGMIGGALSGGDRQASTDILKNIYAKYADLQIPDTEKMKLALEDYKSAGNLTNQTETAQQLGSHDAMQDIAVDPRLRQAQMDQLQAMSRLGDTGVTPGEQAQLNQMQRSVESDNSARLKQMLQQQDQRGVGSSDAALASRMISSQSAANRQAQESDNQAAMIFDRALQAKQAAGTLGGSMENTQYGQQADLATALNSREQQNMLQKAGAGTRNVDRFNQAQQYNLSNNQRLSDSNTGLHNEQQAHNKNLEQVAYDNKLKQLAGMSGQASNLSGAYGRNADATAGMWSNIGGGAGKMLGGAALNKKTDVQTQDDPVNFFGKGKQQKASIYDPERTA